MRHFCEHPTLSFCLRLSINKRSAKQVHVSMTAEESLQHVWVYCRRVNVLGAKRC